MTVEPVGSLREQVTAIRRSVALGVRDDLTLLRFEVDAGLAALEPLVATNLALRDAQFRHALRLDDGGRPILDLIVGFFRGSLYVLARGLPHQQAIHALGASAATPLHEDHVVISLDGPFAWELLGGWDTPTAIGLPFMSAYTPRDGVLVLRAGDAGEYGYRVIAPRAEAEDLLAAMLHVGERMDVGVAGAEAQRHCALQNWVFQIDREGAAWLDALELQLTWRLDLHKEAIGLDAVRSHRAAGLRRRITAIDAPVAVAVGDAVTHGDVEIGRVLAAEPRLFADGHCVVAALDMPWAQAGMDYAIGGHAVRTRSAPFVLNRSLFVNPQRHSWATRDEVELPPGMPWARTTSS